MEKTMNKIQHAYMFAKAHVQEIENKYLTDNGIVNPDGSTPDFLWCMDDNAAFDKANEEVSAPFSAAGPESALNAARADLSFTEDCLIVYCLSLAPVGVRATLERGMK